MPADFRPVCLGNGNNALAAINAGQEDPSERSNVAAGRICGIIGTVILTLGILWAIATFALGIAFFHTANTTFNNVPVKITTVTQSTSSLSTAITNQDVAAVKKLLDQDPSLANKKGMTGETPIFDAAFVGNVEIVQALIDHGADVNATDDFGKKPLDKATFFDHKEIADLLRQHGATTGKAQ